jgi:hypothetical protein
VGFTGATAAVLIGTTPLWGMILATVAAGIGIGLMGEHLHQRDVAIGIVLALMLGLGLLFLHFFTAYATQVTALLFGNVLLAARRTESVILVIGNGADPERNSAVSSASPPKPPSKPSRNAPHPTTRKRPRETLRPFAPRTQTFGVSGCRRCLRRVANARKF